MSQYLGKYGNTDINKLISQHYDEAHMRARLQTKVIANENHKLNLQSKAYGPSPGQDFVVLENYYQPSLEITTIIIKPVKKLINNVISTMSRGIAYILHMEFYKVMVFQVWVLSPNGTAIYVQDIKIECDWVISLIIDERLCTRKSSILSISDRQIEASRGI